MSSSTTVVISATRILSAACRCRRLLLLGLSFALLLAACEEQTTPAKLPPEASAAAAAVTAADAQAATGQAQVEAWAAATGTALHLTALAPTSAAIAAVPPTPVPPTPLPLTAAPTQTASATPLPMSTARPALAPAATATELPRTAQTAAPSATSSLASFTPTPDCAVQNCVPPTVAITGFAIDRTQVMPGDKVTFSWSTLHATHVRLDRIGWGEHNATSWDNLPLTGTLTVTIDGVLRDQFHFELWADNTGAVSPVYGSTAFREANVYLPCPDPLFMNQNVKQTWVDACGAAPAVFSSAVEQPFQHGLMVDLEAQHTIYVFYTVAYYANSEGPSGYDIVPDAWTTGDPESDPTLTPPAGLLQPERGFAKVWREQAHVRDRLGWATAPEKSFAGAYQQDWLTCSGGCSRAGNAYLQTSVLTQVIKIDAAVPQLWGLLNPPY